MDARTVEAPVRRRSSETLIFVYGTLRRGGANHPLLAQARFVREVRSAPRYDLVDLGGFPAMVEGGELSVLGEVFAVDSGTLMLLDELEDHPDYFRRSFLSLEDGEEVQAYLLPGARALGFPRIVSGDWADLPRGR